MRTKHAPCPALAGLRWALAGCVLAAVAASAHPGMHETIERLSRLIAESPDDQRLYLQRGDAYSNDGKLSEALADFRKAESLGDPDLVAFDLGVLYYRSGDYAAARAALSHALARFPNDPRALEYLARAAREAGDARDALASFEALFALGRGVNPGHYVSAAELLAGLEGEGLSAALALLDRGMRQLGVIPQLQQRAIAYERERGTFDAALHRHDTLAASLAHGPEWRVERADLLLALGRRDEADRELEEASAALAELRPTPARAALAARIAQLAHHARPEGAAQTGAQETP